MPIICFSEDQFSFPPITKTDLDGLLLIGGRVTPERVLEAYPKGIFPWYSKEDPPLWWSPDPRFVLFPNELHISRSMQKLIRKKAFTFCTNTAFNRVLTHCAMVPRTGQNGTWLTEEMQAVYTTLHEKGYAHSAEAWVEGRLVGGMYGIRLGNVFFGESMFSLEANASKFAFINYLQQLQQEGVQVVDCQVYTPHVATLGARLIPRVLFVGMLQKWCG